MCGRYYLKISIDKLLEKYDIIDSDFGDITAREIFPSQQAPIILNEKKLRLAKWGLSSSHTKRLIINARAETLDKKKTFKGLFEKKRCLIPVSGFFEWKDQNGTKIKHRINLENQEIFSLAGLYDFSLNSSKNRIIEFVIITTEANKKINQIHHRMPVILSEDKELEWLNNDIDIEKLKNILSSYIDDNIILEPENNQLSFDF